MKRPRATMPDVTKGNSNMHGTPATIKVIEHYRELIYDFCLDYSHTIAFREMLDQLLNYSDEDKKKFDKKAKVIEEQFNNYTAIDDMKVNGALTLGENIADLGGLAIAFSAFKKSQKGKDPIILDGFSPEQRFFLGYAMTEREQIRPELLKKIIVTDPHSPSIFRVNGPLSNMPEFIDAFGVAEGDMLYRDPKERAKIW